MKIAIFGYSGFIGSHIVNVLNNKHDVIKVNARHIKYNSPDEEIFDYFEKVLIKPDFIFNFCANTNPKNKNDIFINENLSSLIEKYINKKRLKTQFFHISTINVLIEERLDNYTISKKNAENNLTDRFTSIIRLPLIINFDNGKKGDLEIFYKYINSKLLPLYPMIYPGNIYRPIEIKNFCNFFLKMIENGNKKQIYNLMGKEQFSIWDIFNKIAIKNKKKTFKINTSILRKVLPNSIKEMIFKSSFFGQFLSIDQSKIETDDII